MLDAIAKKLKMSNGTSSNAKSELEKYHAEENEELEASIDILGWWKLNGHRFPILSHLARDVLAIPISLVASESVFSTSGCILDDFRTSLTPFILEAIVCAQYWIRRGTPIDIQESMEQLTTIEKELIEEFGSLHISKGKGIYCKHVHLQTLIIIFLKVQVHMANCCFNMRMCTLHGVILLACRYIEVD